MTSAREMSRLYGVCLHSHLAGDEVESVDFGLWLDAYWIETVVLPDESCLADADRTRTPRDEITWIEHEDEIVGFLPGRARGCYRIPRGAKPPVIALLLDDAEGCSTGSAHQERASAIRDDNVLDLATPMMRHPIASTPAHRAIPPLPVAVSAPGVASEIGI